MNALAHESQKVGLASAMAIVLLIIIFIATVLQQFIFRYFFGDGDKEPIRVIRKRKKLEMQRALSIQGGGEK